MGSEFSFPFYLFENTKEPSNANCFCFSDPKVEIKTKKYSELESCLRKIEELSSKGYFLAGYVSYEAGLPFAEISNGETSDFPLLHFHAFDKKNRLEVDLEAKEKVVLNSFTRDLGFEDYIDAYSEVQKYLIRGDTYQINLSLREYFKGPKNAFTLYKILRQTQKVPYASFICLEDLDILSFSPELFLKKEGDDLYCLPMKGTTSNSIDFGSVNLENDPKSLSENTMIVDLIRNDMSQIAVRGSVKAEKLCYTEQYETLTQMISEVKCKVDKDRSILEIFKALFPCGSITGAPKRNTMNIISKLEKSRRDLYTGAIGYIEPNGNFSFNVAIRTITGNKQGDYTVGLGSGVLAESDPIEEHNEIWLKSKFIKTVNSNFRLFETLRLENGVFKNLPLHLDRLEKSAKYFGFFFDRKSLESKIDCMKVSEQAMRCKISVEYDGDFKIELENLTEDPSAYKISVSAEVLNSSDYFLAHKTSNRELYTKEYEKASKNGLYDVLFFNEREELCEASRHNVFLKQGGNWFTPKLSSGILPGVQRKISIERLGAIERNLSLNDLQNADEIILTNSLRGEVSVNLVD